MLIQILILPGNHIANNVILNLNNHVLKFLRNAFFFFSFCRITFVARL